MCQWLCFLGQSGGSYLGFPMQSGGSCWQLSESGRVTLANGMFCSLDVSNNFVSFSSRLRVLICTECWAAYASFPHQQADELTSQLIPSFCNSSAASRLYPTILPYPTRVTSVPSFWTCTCALRLWLAHNTKGLSNACCMHQSDLQSVQNNQ